MSVDLERRFGGVTRLYGTDGAERLRSANVCVVGIGGVGSWSVEALARTGVGQITVVDLDMVAESNTNRQIHALGDIYGKSKVDAISERILAINPDCKVSIIEDFVTPENVKSILDQNFSVVIDAIDQVRAKAAIASFCREINTPIIVAGAAGGKIDPTRISAADLSRTIQDPLLAKVRSILRREYGFPKDPKKKFNVSAIFSTEPVRYPDRTTTCDTEKSSLGLNCTGFGSSVCVTSVFGMVAAAEAIKQIIQN
ncbi:MAG: tRNA cyclic N6-threonylcarbamoyladenosine(37) synthase TcdA [Betaproteobacteria bacterium HGW-Betaproteobacteria-4]|jgi:tRNA A37 threonylcarbamoyladenosine dehydratase|nr:MAG: tRNA cyclic N6-threonylcarbamoyladenosine(37) synthase TcdA [Betaproteobacteria bacterium HGW-Betaproteobacteria-4]